MAFNLSKRFPTSAQPCQLLDPGSYQNTNSLVIKPNKIPFLSKCPRNTQPHVKIWTHALYSCDIRSKIPNCTTISSKIPRFAYKIIENENVQPIICQCGIQNPCECLIEEEKANSEEKIICHAEFRRRLFKGPVSHFVVGKNNSTAFRKDHKFQILPHGSKVRLLKQTKDNGPPFYDARVLDSNTFYRGCKWSKWTSQRSNVTTSINQTPGPADYKINENQPSYDVLCAEKLRASKRKTSKQLRFIETIQRHNILENRPGPANYNPVSPKGTNLKFIGSKAERFILPKYNDTPNPTTYFIKRYFDVNKSDFKPCLTNLPSRAPFSVKASRFKYRPENGPSPVSYNLNNISCQLKHCNTAPFGSCSKRFTDICEKDMLNHDENNLEKNTFKNCYKCNQLPMWAFRSKTIRMKPLIKIIDEPGPADLVIFKGSSKKRLPQFQYVCPFYSSEARFKNWFNWIPVQGKEKTPGPASYNLEKRRGTPAVRSGPLNRAERFTYDGSQTLAPNAYKVKRGLEDILTTYNQRLKNNIKNTHKYHTYKEPVEQRELNLDEQEIILLNKSIALLDVPDIFKYVKQENKKTAQSLIENKTKQPKLLRSFLYTKKIKQYF